MSMGFPTGRHAVMSATSDAEGEIGFLMAIASQLFTTRVTQVVGRASLTYTQFSMLSHLQGAEASTINEIAAAMEINQPGVSKVVQRLDEEGLLAVELDPTDSRRKQVSITASGRRALVAAEELLEVDGANWFDGWAPDDLHKFRDQLAVLVGWLDANRLDG